MARVIALLSLGRAQHVYIEDREEEMALSSLKARAVSSGTQGRVDCSAACPSLPESSGTCWLCGRCRERDRGLLSV